MRLLRFTWLGLFAPVALAVVPFAAAQQPPKESARVSCQRFAQQFYDWYASFGQQESHQASAASALNVSAGAALRDRPNWFSHTLRTALQSDIDAQLMGEDIAGIDFDPFFGSQDPPEHYVVRIPVVHNSRCSVQVWGYPRITPAERTGKPNAIAELKFHNGHWFFTDFKYPDTKSSLLDFLEFMRLKPAGNY